MTINKKMYNKYSISFYDKQIDDSVNENLNPYYRSGSLVNKYYLYSIASEELSEMGMQKVQNKIPSKVQDILNLFTEFRVLTFLLGDTAFDILCTANNAERYNILLIPTKESVNLNEIINSLKEKNYKLNDLQIKNETKEILYDHLGYSIHVDNYDINLIDYNEYAKFESDTILRCPKVSLNDYDNYEESEFHNSDDDDYSFLEKIKFSKPYNLNLLNIENSKDQIEIYNIILHSIRVRMYQIMICWNTQEIIMSHTFYHFYTKPSYSRNTEESSPQYGIIDEYRGISFVRFNKTTPILSYNLCDFLKLAMKTNIFLEMKERHHRDLKSLLILPLYSNAYNLIYYEPDTMKKIVKESNKKEPFINSQEKISNAFIDTINIKQSVSNFFNNDRLLVQYTLDIPKKYIKSFQTLSKRKQLEYFKNVLEYAFRDTKEFNDLGCILYAKSGYFVTKLMLSLLYPNINEARYFKIPILNQFITTSTSYAQNTEVITTKSYLDIEENLIRMVSSYLFLRHMKPFNKKLFETNPNDILSIIITSIYFLRSVVKFQNEINIINDTDDFDLGNEVIENIESVDILNVMSNPKIYQNMHFLLENDANLYGYDEKLFNKIQILTQYLSKIIHVLIKNIGLSFYTPSLNQLLWRRQSDITEILGTHWNLMNQEDNALKGFNTNSNWIEEFKLFVELKNKGLIQPFIVMIEYILSYQNSLLPIDIDTVEEKLLTTDFLSVTDELLKNDELMQSLHITREEILKLMYESHDKNQFNLDKNYSCDFTSECILKYLAYLVKINQIKNEHDALINKVKELLFE